MGWELLQIACFAKRQIKLFLDLLDSEDVTNKLLAFVN